MPTEVRDSPKVDRVSPKPKLKLSSFLPQILTSHEGLHITDKQRENAFAQLIPEKPDLGGQRSDRDLREVLTGKVVEHKPDMQVRDEILDIRGLRVEPVTEGVVVPDVVRPVAVNRLLNLPRPRPVRRDNGGNGGGNNNGGGERGDGGGAGGGAGDGGGGREGSPNPENLGSPESPEGARIYVEQVLEMRTTKSYNERYGIVENKIRIGGLYGGIQKFVNGVIKDRHGQSPFGEHMHFPKPTRSVIQVEGRSVEVLTPAEFPKASDAIESMRQEAIRFKERYELGDVGAAEVGSRGAWKVEPLPDQSDQERSLARMAQKFNESDDPEVVRTARSELLNYFKNAKNRGLFDDVDAALNSLYKQVTTGAGRMSPDQTEEVYERGLAIAMSMGQRAFRNKMLQEDETLRPPQQLNGVWEPYVDWASQRIRRAMIGANQERVLEGEWSIRTPEQEGRARRETYWGLGPYPKMYQITAETEDQFVTAKETFLTMVRSGMLGRAPTANFEHVKNFIDEFSRTGGEKALEGRISEGFLEENRLELEALLYLLVANYAKEVYNPQQAKEAAMAMASDEGPARWVRAYRAGRGKVAVFTHMFDYEEMMDIFNNSVGERGELDIVAGQFLQDTVREIAIERGMGVVIKDYDPRDEYFSKGESEVRRGSSNNWDLGSKIQAAIDLKGIEDKLSKIQEDIDDGKIKLNKGETPVSKLDDRDQARWNAYRTNLNRLGLTKNTEDFKELYEGFDKGDYHIKNYKAYQEDLKESREKPGYARKYAELAKLPESIQKSIRIGRAQVQLKEMREAILKGEFKLESGKKPKDHLDPKDREAYEEAYVEAASNFEIAFQMQNVMGEKARRGKGFIYIDRNKHVQNYFEVSDKLRCRWASESERKEFLNKDEKVINLDGLSIQQIDKLIPHLILTKVLSSEEVESFKKGWMIYKVSRDKKKPASFTQEWKTLYEGMSDEEKEDVVDNIPTYKAENWVQWGVTQIKMKYADAPVEVRRQKVTEGWRRLIKEVKTKGYSARLWEPGEKGRRQLMTYKRPLGRIDAETGKFRKYKHGEVLGYNSSGQPIELRFGNNGRPLMPFTDGKLVVYDSADPTQRDLVTIDGITPNTIARQVDQQEFAREMDRVVEEGGDIGSKEEFTKLRQDLAKQVASTLVEEVVPTFDFAAGGSDFRSNYTQDSYNYYQGNDRVTAFQPHVLMGKYAIAAGLSRPEDEDLLARRGLVVDPTRRRTRKLPDVQQQREVTLVAAAVLESMQDRMRIRHGIYRAFLPKDAYVGRMRMGYRNEDWAGMDRFTFGFVELAAQQPQRFARRFGAEIAISPLEHDSGPARWGASGLSEGVKMMADEIKQTSGQAIKGQFGLTKVFESQDKAIEIFNHLVGYTDKGRHVYGLYRKPTDNNEKMHKNLNAAQSEGILGNPTHAIPFLYDFKECFGRLQTVVQDMEVMYSSIDNSAGGLNLEDHEVFFADGSFNTAIETDLKIIGNNGVGRNRQTAFLDGEDGEQGFYRWLVDESPGGGAHVYPDEGYWNYFLFNHYSKAEARRVRTRNALGVERVQWLLRPVEAGLIKDWLTDKIR